MVDFIIFKIVIPINKHFEYLIQNGFVIYQNDVLCKILFPFWLGCIVACVFMDNHGVTNATMFKVIQFIYFSTNISR
jgi:hypothetical protein